MMGPERDYAGKLHSKRTIMRSVEQKTDEQDSIEVSIFMMDVYKPMMEAYMRALASPFPPVESMKYSLRKHSAHSDNDTETEELPTNLNYRKYDSSGKYFQYTDPFKNKECYIPVTSYWEKLCLSLGLSQCASESNPGIAPIDNEIINLIEKYSIRRYTPVYSDHRDLDDSQHDNPPPRDRIQISFPDNYIPQNIGTKEFDYLANHLANSDCDIIIMQQWASTGKHDTVTELIKKIKEYQNNAHISYFDINPRAVIGKELYDAVGEGNVFTLGLDNINKKEKDTPPGIHINVPQHQFTWKKLGLTLVAMVSKEIQEDLILLSFDKLWSEESLSQILTWNTLKTGLLNVPKTALKVTAFPLKLGFYGLTMLYLWMSKKNESVFEIPVTNTANIADSAAKYSLRHPKEAVLFSKELPIRREKTQLIRKFTPFSNPATPIKYSRATSK
jgi:hypothetical protein